MGKVIEEKIIRFDGGMENDIRVDNSSAFAFSKNFDTLSFPNKIIPNRSYEEGNDTVARKIANFTYYNGKLWGLGEQTTPKRAQIFYKDTFTDGTWSTTSNNVIPVTVASILYDTFVQYKGNIYGFGLNTSIWKYDTTGVASAVTTDKTVSATITSTAQGLVFSNDILYMPYNNIIAKKNDSTWTDSVLTLPTNLKITSICEYGNYLAVAAVSTDPLTQASKVFLWDTTSTTWNEVIDWGAGELNVIEEIDGLLIGISLAKRETSNNLLFHSTLSFKYYAGAQGAVEFKKIDGSRDSTITPISFLGLRKQKVNNRIYFNAMITTKEGVQTKEGVWSVGRVSPNSPYAVTVEHESRTYDGTVPNAIDGFFLAGSYVFIAYSNTGSLSGNISKTNNAETYTNPSVYESLIKNGGDVSKTKNLIGVTVATYPQPAAGQIILYYKKDAETTWTAIFTDGTDDSLSHSSIVLSTGVQLPQFKEIQFRIESTGGAVVTGLSFEYEVLEDRNY